MAVPSRVGKKRFVSFAIIGKGDVCLFEHSEGDCRDKDYMYKMHAALDIIDERIWDPSSSSNNKGVEGLFLGREVDKYEEEGLIVSAYVTFGHLRFVLLQEKGAFNGTEEFFRLAHELCAKHLANPFTDPGIPFDSEPFRNRIIALFNSLLVT